jgi:hypothetical protein
MLSRPTFSKLMAMKFDCHCEESFAALKDKLRDEAISLFNIDRETRLSRCARDGVLFG